jgi:hypothetical protein
MERPEEFEIGITLGPVHPAQVRPFTFAKLHESAAIATVFHCMVSVESPSVTQGRE